jgi:eukaryotic-like serine/threonine-protein kinase
LSVEVTASHQTVPSTPVGDPPFGVGETIAQKYRIERIVGIGGMAIVFAAHHLELDQPIAIKVLLPDHASNPDLVRRFLTEARAAAKLKSVHVARISDVATVESRARRVLPIIVMELLDGRDLATVVEEKGRLAPAHAMSFVLQACDAVAEAHALGIVHRDLKPANLFLVERRDGSPIVKLLDFGISKSLGAIGGPSGHRPIFGRGSAKETELVGTPAYMSPEQIEGSTVDHRTDVWSLGVILYELLTGRDPFAAPEIDATLDNVLNTSPRPIATIAPEVPPNVVAIVDRCLEKDRARRFQSVAELAAALSDAVGEMSITGMSRIGNVASTRVDLSMTTAKLDRSPARKIFLGSMLILGVVGLMLLAASVAVLRARSHDAQAHPAVAAPPPESAFPPAPPLPPTSAESAPKPAETTGASSPPSTTPSPNTRPLRPPATRGLPSKRPNPNPTPSGSSYHRTDW